MVRLLISCNTPQQPPSIVKEEISKQEVITPERVSDIRDKVSATAAASYRKKVPNDLNEWYFSVKLFETQKIFTYRVYMQYEEVTGEDELTFPDLGMEPKPYIEAGPEPYAAVIGFLDKQGNKKEYKKIVAENGNLRITTLKYYRVNEVIK
jgi:hypothetical protein